MTGKIYSGRCIKKWPKIDLKTGDLFTPA